ncbi:MAG: cell division protein FtsZ [Methanophagales archaeon]|nr:cell division protein FtsZ [Methanophagales archaeon]
MGDMLGYNREEILEPAEDGEGDLFGIPQLAIIGIGGAGNNSMNRLEQMGGLNGVSRIAINTDKLHLDSIRCETKILIGRSLTRGLGAGGSPDIGRKAAELDRDELGRLVSNKNFVFLTAGMGGGTGTGATPVIADIAKDAGAIVVAMVSYPFEAERVRRKRAMEGIERLKDATDTVIILENEKLIKYAGNLPVNDAFKTMDILITETIQGITETITKPSLVNIDFADLRSVMEAGGVAVMFVGETTKSENKPEAVVEAALSHPLLEVDYRGAMGALIHITGGSDLTMKETNDIVELLTYELDSNANVIWGARINDEYNGRARVTAIMTGVEPKWIFGGVLEDRKESVARGTGGGLSDIIPIIRRS